MARYIGAAILLLAVFFGIKVMIGGRSTEPGGSVTAPAEIISTIAVGERFELAQHIPDQGVVLVEFTADW